MEQTMSDERTVQISWTFEAPREQVFRAWTEPEEIARWYGPAHMEAPPERITVDLRVGGRWELTMVRRDGGGEFSIGYEIVELSAPELLVLKSDPMPEMGMDEGTVVRVELHEQGEQTRLTLTDGPLPPPARDGAEAGWGAALEKLADQLRD